MAIKGSIDLISLLAKAAAGLRLGERIGAVPNLESERTRNLKGRIDGAQAVTSVCPYCAVGCSTLAYVNGSGKLLDVEGNPASPINAGHLCPKGAAIFGLTVNTARWTTVKYRAPFATEWEDKPLDWALDRIAEKFKATREATFVKTLPDGKRVNQGARDCLARRRDVRDRGKLSPQQTIPVRQRRFDREPSPHLT